MEFLDPKLDAYIEAHTAPESSLLQELSRETQMKVLQPRMLSGHLQGRVLSLFSRLLNPKRILEVGTYTGYSAICLAEGLQDGGRIDTIDKNEELEPMISKYVEKAGLSEKIHLHIGDAREIIPTLDGNFDLVFIDADKENYNHYYEAVIDRVSKGGLIIADNVLWSGKVIDENELKNDLDTLSLDKFNKMVLQDDRVENVLFPVRDGLMIARKK